MPYFTVNGLRLHYREQGSGPVLLILPGDTSSAAHHSGELDHFCNRFRTVCLDFWGTGFSERASVWPADWWEICTEHAATLVRHLDDAPAVVVGQSGGAAIALMMAIRNPHLVRAVVSDSQVERLPADWLRDIVAQRHSASPSTILFWQRAHGDDWESVVAADDRAILARAAAGDINWYGGRLAELECPVLLTGSLSDHLMPDLPGQILAMARQIKDCNVYLCASGGHPLMWTRPLQFRAAVDCFLTTLPD